jgi:hypothetical protein
LIDEHETTFDLELRNSRKEIIPENKKGEACDLARENFSVRLIIRSGFRHDIHATAAFVEIHFAIDESEQCPIATGADIFASHKLRSALANDNAACGDDVTAKLFHAQSLADAIPTVTNTSLTFLVCHKIP